MRNVQRPVRSRKARHIGYHLMAAALAVLVSSQSVRAQGLTTSDQASIGNLLGAGVLGAAVPAGALQNPASLLPLRGATFGFQIVSGPNAGNPETDTLVPSPSGSPSPWQYTAGTSTVYAPAGIGRQHRQPERAGPRPGRIDSLRSAASLPLAGGIARRAADPEPRGQRL
jgi:hypothetical protein